MSCYRALPAEPTASPAWRSALRRLLAGGLAMAVALPAVDALAQAKPAQGQQQKPFHIFMVQWRGETQTDKGFRDFFRNRRIAVTYTVRNPQRDRGKFPEIVAEIKRVRPDLVYTWGTGGARAVNGTLKDTDPERHVTDIPVVSCMVTNPTVAGLIEEWGPSGRNFTGVSHVPDENSQLRAMKSYRKVTRIAALYDSQQRNAVSAVESLDKLTKQEKIEFMMLPVGLNAEGKSDPATIPALVREAAAFKPDFLYLGPDTFLYVNRKPLFEAAADVNLPAFAAAEGFLTKGDALFGLVGNYYIVGQYCASKGARILTEDTEPGAIPFDRLSRFSLKVNMSAARRLDIYPPMDLLAITEVIKAGETAAVTN